MTLTVDEMRDAPITDIPGIGAATKERLENIGYENVYDLATDYLTTHGKEIKYRVQDVYQFHKFLANQTIPNEELGVDEQFSIDVVGMMLLARERDAQAEYLKDGVEDREHIEMRSKGVVDGRTLQPHDLKFGWTSVVVTGDEQLTYGNGYIPEGMDYDRVQFDRGVEVTAVDGEKRKQVRSTAPDKRVTAGDSGRDEVCIKSEQFETVCSMENIRTLNMVLGIELEETPERAMLIEDYTWFRVEDTLDDEPFTKGFVSAGHP